MESNRQKEVVEGNILIAKFMGWKLITKSPNGLIPEHYERGHDWYNSASDFEYHSSWNELMPVVEKIESLYDGNAFVVNIIGVWCTVEMATQFGMAYSEIEYETIKIRDENKIQSVWQAVVEFIQWYNNSNRGNK